MATIKIGTIQNTTNINGFLVQKYTGVMYDFPKCKMIVCRDLSR